jgi:hypothetical protein
MPMNTQDVISVLVEECGARASTYAQDDLALWLEAGAPGREFRFMGSLGFGGKIYVERERHVGGLLSRGRDPGAHRRH